MNFEGILFTGKYLLFFTGLYRCLYFLLNYILSHNNEYNLLNINKQKYVVKNIGKSMVLFYLVLNNSIIFEIYKDINLVRYYASIYVANDFLALMYVDKLPFTTKLHHYTTVFLLFIFAIATNLNYLILKLTYIYTICS